MVINEELTGDEASAEATPAGAVSDVIIEDLGSGFIALQAQAPGSSNWVNVSIANGAFSVATPDSNVTYRFKATDVTGSTLVYFGV